MIPDNNLEVVADVAPVVELAPVPQTEFSTVAANKWTLNKGVSSFMLYEVQLKLRKERAAITAVMVHERDLFPELAAAQEKFSANPILQRAIRTKAQHDDAVKSVAEIKATVDDLQAQFDSQIGIVDLEESQAIQVRLQDAREQLKSREGELDICDASYRKVYDLAVAEHEREQQAFRQTVHQSALADYNAMIAELEAVAGPILDRISWARHRQQRSSGLSFTAAEKVLGERPATPRRPVTSGLSEAIPAA